MTPTPTAPMAAEPFVGPFHVEGPSVTATWRVLDDNFQFVSREFFDPAPAQFICDRLNASIPQPDAKSAAEEIDGLYRAATNSTNWPMLETVAAIISRHIPQAAQDGETLRAIFEPWAVSRNFNIRKMLISTGDDPQQEYDLRGTQYDEFGLKSIAAAIRALAEKERGS